MGSNLASVYFKFLIISFAKFDKFILRANFLDLIFFKLSLNQILESFHPCKYCKVSHSTLMREKIQGHCVFGGIGGFNTCTMTMGVLLATAWWAVSRVPGPPSSTSSTTGTNTWASTNTNKQANYWIQGYFYLVSWVFFCTFYISTLFCRVFNLTRYECDFVQENQKEKVIPVLNSPTTIGG